MSTHVREARLRRHRRVRGKVSGTAERPRLVVFRSNKGIFAQLVDDESRRTLASATWLSSGLQGHEDRAGCRGRQGARRCSQEGRYRDLRLRPGGLPLPRTREGPRRGRTRGRTPVLRDVEVAESRELKERVIEINRVAKVVKGGRRFSFTALVVIGDEVDRVGVGYGKAREVPLAISKAVDDAKKNIFTVPKHGATITHEITGRFDAARVVLRRRARDRRHRRWRRPRRARARGIRDVLAKSLGTTNPINMAGRRWTAQAPPPPRGRRPLARQVDQRRAAVPAAGRRGCRGRRDPPARVDAPPPAVEPESAARRHSA